MAFFLYDNLKLINSVNIGSLIGESSPLCTEIRKSYISVINFKDDKIDVALRKLLTYFTLPGPTESVERIIEAFS